MLDDVIINVGNAIVEDINRKLEQPLNHPTDNVQENIRNIIDLPIEFMRQLIPPQKPIETVQFSNNIDTTNTTTHTNQSPIPAPRKLMDSDKMYKNRRHRRDTDGVPEFVSKNHKHKPRSKQYYPHLHKSYSASSLSSSSTSSFPNIRQSDHRIGFKDIESGLDKCLMPKFKENVIICNSKNVNMKYKDRSEVGSAEMGCTKKYRVFLISYVSIITIMIFLITSIILYTIYH